MGSGLKAPRFPLWLAVIVAITAVAVVTGGVWLYIEQNRSAQRNVEHDLVAIGRLKADQIANWRAERLSDGRVVAENPSSQELIVRWFATGKPEDTAEVLGWFDVMKTSYGYSNVRLVDPQGDVLLDLARTGEPLAPEALQGLEQAFTGDKAVLTDLHLHNTEKSVHQDVIAPFFGEGGPASGPLGAVMTIDANTFLFPLIQTWPTSSSTAETLLVRREGDEVLYLNSLRFRPDAALNLRFTLTSNDLPAVKAVMGTQGIVEGVDYRGVEVIAAVQPVPDSPWFIVSKTDRSEAFGGARVGSWLTIGLTVLLLAALLSGTGITWQRSLKRRYLVAYEAEMARRSVLARYEHLVKQANDMILLVDEDLLIVEANDRAAELCGYLPEELMDMRLTDLIPPDGVEPFEQARAELERNGSHVWEVALKCKDSRILPVEASGRVIHLEGRQYLQVISRDVSERREAERVLRTSRERYRAIALATAQIIWVTDPAGVTIEQSPTLGDYTGLTDEELLAKGWYSAIHPDDLPDASEVMRVAIASQRPYEVELRLRRADGEYGHFWVRGVPVFDSSGGLSEWVGACTDISGRKRAEDERLQLERQFEQSQRLESLGVLAGGIAHDFNNILMAVLGYAELAAADLPLGSQAREHVKEISLASHRAADLCRQMLAYSGRGSFATEAIDLRELIDSMVHLLSSSISKKTLLNLNLAKNLPSIMGDASQIDQVIMNLVINASEAIGERSGVITISTGLMECSREYLRETYLDEGLVEGLYVTLEVSDTGIGMDKETCDRLFEPFFSTKFTGRGLGLAAVLGIVRGHKGAIKVYSEPGKGTTFKLLFPAAESERSKLAPWDDVDGAWKGSGTILLVEDEETVRLLGTRMLARLGYDVLTASDGREALEIYRNHEGRIELVLLDLTMPHMNGEETFRELRRMDPDVRILLSSGYTESDIASRFAGKGLAGFIQKPYTPGQLGEQLRKILG